MEDAFPMKDAAQKLSVCAVSVASADGIGGLSSYVRFLLAHLAPGCMVSAAARSRVVSFQADYAAQEPVGTLDHGAFQTRLVAPRAAYRPLLRQMLRLITRPRWRALGVAVFRAAFRKSLAAAIPPQTQVVHYVGAGWDLLGFAALAEARQRRVVFSVLPAIHPGSWGDKPLDVLLYQQADAVLVLSEHEREHLIGLGVRRDRLHVLGLAPAQSAAGDGRRFREQHGLGDRPLVLFVGGKDRSHGYHAVCEAMPPLLAALPDACLVAIGSDREPPYPPVPTASLLDLGEADEQVKADAQAACDVFCMPARDASFGIAYVEAWVYGKPVIGGPAPAVRELITDDVNGFCVPQDTDALRDALVKLLSDPARAQRLGAAGRALQQARYTWEIVADAHRQVWEDAVRGKTAQETP